MAAFPRFNAVSPMLIVCLCAEWCGTCRGFRADFDRYAAEHPQHALRWIDVEDEAELVGDLDIETFPSLLLVERGEPVFYGPILPGYDALARTVARPGGVPVTDPDARALAAQLSGAHMP